MNLHSKKIPTADELIAAHPIRPDAEADVLKHRAEIEAILSGRDDRLMVIVGPCSAWPSPAVLEYAEKLKALEPQVRHALKLVMRVYIQKPRTTVGWTGPVNQPDPFAPADIAEGALQARKLMVKVAEMGLPIADEAVFTHNARGFMELLSWVAIGARSTEDQEHRIFASNAPAPVGMKNPTSGSIRVGVNSVIAAQHPHTAVFDGHQVTTSGNPFAHLVLRGGESGPNFHLDKLYEARELLHSAKVKNPALIIDASHENCRMNGQKKPETQMDVVREVMHNLRIHPELRDTVKGFMVESFLKCGAQKLEDHTPETLDRNGLSITDPCISWETTEELLLDTARIYKSL